MENAPGSFKVATTEQAVSWISGGWELFKKTPGMWIAIFILYIVLISVLGMVPLVGSFATSLLGPVLIFGLMQGTKDLQSGGELKIDHLFSGFQHPRLSALVILGVLSLAITIAMVLVTALGIGGMVVAGGGFDVENMANIGVGAALGGLIFLFAMFFLFAAFLFAAPLVGFRGMQPVEAVKLSFAAAFANWLSLLIWSLLGMLIFLVGLIPLGLGLLVAGPVLIASYYFAYRDIFGAD